MLLINKDFIISLKKKLLLLLLLLLHTVAHKGNVNNKSDIKFKFLTSISNSSFQIQIPHSKFKFLTSNSNSSLVSGNNLK